MSVTFPDKLYYKIGEVAQIAGVRTSVLRFWESEFEFLRPEKSTTGQRLYSKKEVELILEVKRLLYTEKFTLEGVRKRISSRGRFQHHENINQVSSNTDHILLLRAIRSDLQNLRYQL